MHTITTPAQIGATIANRRKALKLSQTDVARRLGLSQNRLSELEARPQSLTVEQLLALLNVLGLELAIATTSRKLKVEW